jgi:hypothetical protein
MTTTQSADPDEKVDHPRHYNQHTSGIETIELIEHLPCNLANAVKYLWRCGLKQTETPLRDLRSALWYTQREEQRIDHFELTGEPTPKTDVVWRALARRVIEAEFKAGLDSALASYLRALLIGEFDDMTYVIEGEIGDHLKGGAA